MWHSVKRASHKECTKTSKYVHRPSETFLGLDIKYLEYNKATYENKDILTESIRL